MKTQLFDVIIYPEQDAQDQSATHKQVHLHRVENIKQITQHSDESKRSVGPEKRGLPLPFQAKPTNGQPDEQGKQRH